MLTSPPQAATLFAVMKDTEYAAKPVFVENFFKCFRQVLKGQNKEMITQFSKCDFTTIYNWHAEEREKKKAMTTEVRPAVAWISARRVGLGLTCLLCPAECRRRRSSRLTRTRPSCPTPPASWTEELKR